MVASPPYIQYAILYADLHSPNIIWHDACFVTAVAGAGADTFIIRYTVLPELYSPQLYNYRDITVYVPPSLVYETCNASHRHPVVTRGEPS